MSAGGKEIDLNLQENDAKALNVSPEVALDLKSDNALHIDRTERSPEIRFATSVTYFTLL